MSSTSLTPTPPPTADQSDAIRRRAFGARQQPHLWRRWLDRAAGFMHEVAYYAGAMPAPGSDLDVFPDFDYTTTQQTNSRRRD